MTNENYITIQGWMIKSLHLKGNELLTYAIIFGFSQDKEHWFKGSSKYLEEALQCSRRNAVNVLSSLVQKGLLEKKQESIEGIVFNRYRCVLDSSYTYAESSQGVYEKSAHSNIVKVIMKKNTR